MVVQNLPLQGDILKMLIQVTWRCSYELSTTHPTPCTYF